MQERFSLKMTFVWALLILAAPAIHADAAVIGASKDNTLYETTNGELSNGVGDHIFAGKTNQGSIRRAVIAFDITGNVPAGSTIIGVTLTLNMSKTTAAGQSAVGLHVLEADWGEGSSDAPSNEGSGATSATGDATWVHRMFNTIFWTSAGGDFNTAASATTQVGTAGSYSWSSAQMIADVQGWLDSPGSNFGWLIQGDETANRTSKRFDSRENPVPNLRPELTVEFTPPPIPALTPWGIFFLATLLLTIGALIIVKRPGCGRGPIRV